MILLCIQAAFLAAMFLVTSSFAAPTLMLPVDVLTLPGAQARIGARFVRQGSQKADESVEGLAVVLKPASAQAAGKKPPPGLPEHTVVTATAGLALAPLTAPQTPGIFHFDATLESPEARAVKPPRADVVLQLVPEDGGLLIVKVPDAFEIDLRADDGSDTPTAPPISLAASALKDLSRYHAVVYFTSRTWRSAPGIRRRLRLLGLPDGAVVGRPVDAHADTLHEAVGQLGLDRWKGSRWVILTHGDEAFHFTQVGFRAVVLRGTAAASTDERTIFAASSWGEAEAKIVRHSP